MKMLRFWTLRFPLIFINLSFYLQPQPHLHTFPFKNPKNFLLPQFLLFAYKHNFNKHKYPFLRGYSDGKNPLEMASSMPKPPTYERYVNSHVRKSTTHTVRETKIKKVLHVRKFFFSWHLEIKKRKKPLREMKKKVIYFGCDMRKKRREEKSY